MKPGFSDIVAGSDDRLHAAERLLLGGDPVAAAGLYREAMAGGGAGAAAERLAVLAAVGVARDADWVEALDLLAESAALGWAPARGQLAALTGQEELPDNSDWRQVRRGIGLEMYLAPPRTSAGYDRPAIVHIHSLATPAMCRWIIRRGQERLQPSLINDAASGQAVPDPIRTGSWAGFGLAHTDLVVVLTQERLARVSRLMVHQQEAPVVLTYEPGQRYLPHFDFIDPSVPAYAGQLAVMGQRVATCLTWLNDDYEGGETEFPRLKWRHRGRVGDAMLFLNVTPDRRPDPLTLHAGLPPTRGRKWLLSQWVRDRVQAIV